MVFSLFGGKQHCRHIAAEQDVAEELFALLAEAREIYLHDVVAGGMAALWMTSSTVTGTLIVAT